MPVHRHKIGLFSLIMSGMSSIIGSGWLFGSWKAARLAGPAALLAWPIGAVIMVLIAMAYAELAARYPATGGMVRYTQYSHGSLAGFIAGWANWISIVSVIPIEAVSSIQYVSSWPYSWTQALYLGSSKGLSQLGLFLSAILIVIYFLLNYWSIKLFLRSMVYATLFKIAVPFITCVALIIAAFTHQHHVITSDNFMPYGVNGLFTAISTAGIIFSFNGFQTPINLSGEARNPQRDVPLAVFISVGIAIVLYTLLQFAFITSIQPGQLTHGWAELNMSSPFAHLALAFNLNWLAVIIYADAFVSPSGTAVTYTATTARMLLGMQKNGYMPKTFGKLHPKFHIPRTAMWANLIVSFLFLYLFRGWSQLVAIISVATIITYVTGPVSAVALKRWSKNNSRPLHIRGLNYCAPIAFIIISWVLYWARWPLTGEVILIMIAGLPIYFFHERKYHWRRLAKHWKNGLWLIIYLVVIALISFIGSTSYGGRGFLNTWASIIVLSVVSIGFYFWGLHSSYVKKMGRPSGLSQ